MTSDVWQAIDELTGGQIKSVMRAVWQNKDAIGKFAQWSIKLWTSLHGAPTP